MFKQKQRVWYVTETNLWGRKLVVRGGWVREDLGDLVKLEGRPDGIGYKVYPTKKEAKAVREELLSFVQKVRGRRELELSKADVTLMDEGEVR